MASAGPRDARTQGGRNSSAIRPTEDAAARSAPGAASAARGRGERTPEGPVYLRNQSTVKLPESSPLELKGGNPLPGPCEDPARGARGANRLAPAWAESATSSSFARPAGSSD